MYAIREPVAPPLPLASWLRPLARAPREVVAFVYLDRAGRVVGLRHSPSIAFLAVEVPLRAVAADALALGAHRVVLAHNHPSGDPEPSRDDIVVTRRIAAALSALGIRLVDHLVLGANAGFTSLRARGLL